MFHAIMQFIDQKNAIMQFPLRLILITHTLISSHTNTLNFYFF